MENVTTTASDKIMKIASGNFRFYEQRLTQRNTAGVANMWGSGKGAVRKYKERFEMSKSGVFVPLTSYA